MKWIERKFRFDAPLDLFPNIIERLRGTAPRIEEKIRGVPPAVLTCRDGQAWSAQEHMGHLLDLEELSLVRLDEFQRGESTLLAANVQNPKTFAANYNQRKAAEVLQDFRQERGKFIARLENWDRATLERTAIHPRLQQPMRVMDMAFFIAEHDDHHLTKMTKLLGKFS